MRIRPDNSLFLPTAVYWVDASSAPSATLQSSSCVRGESQDSWECTFEQVPVAKTGELKLVFGDAAEACRNIKGPCVWPVAFENSSSLDGYRTETTMTAMPPATEPGILQLAWDTGDPEWSPPVGQAWVTLREPQSGLTFGGPIEAGRLEASDNCMAFNDLACGIPAGLTWQVTAFLESGAVESIAGTWEAATHPRLTVPCPDADGDGYPLAECAFENGDCQDGDSAIHPGGVERCNLVDDNCDGSIDEGTLTVYYRDSDTDSYGNAQDSVTTCFAPDGYVLDDTDCDDTLSTSHPGASEVCDGLDNDCDSLVDEDVLGSYYPDQDNDGHGTASDVALACDPPSGYVSSNDDCNDQNASIYPGATETCDGIDQDCNGNIDDGVLGTVYQDSDADGYGDPAVSSQPCPLQGTYVSNNLDCNDQDASIHPGATEVCDGIDQNCDGTIDEGLSGTFYLDSDGDGFGDPEAPSSSCSESGGYIGNSLDCNDDDAAIHPGALEVCDGRDQDCDGSVDEEVTPTTWFRDQDGDGFGGTVAVTAGCPPDSSYLARGDDCDDTDPGTYPGAVDSAVDGRDANCDGLTDTASRVAGLNGDLGDDGPATDALFNIPKGVAVAPSGDIYVADTSNHRIRVIGPDGRISTVVGDGLDDYAGMVPPLSYPGDVAVDSQGSVYIADTFNYRILRYHSGFLEVIAGNGTSGSGGDGGPATLAQLQLPYGIAVSSDGTLYIADTNNHVVRMVDTDGKITRFAGNGSSQSGVMAGDATDVAIPNPIGVAVDADGNVFIADQYEAVVLKVDTSGYLSVFAGNGSVGTSGDGGLATDAQLQSPTGIAVDAAGTVYIADTYAQRIRKVSSSGIITTIAGNGSSGFGGDGGTATDGYLNQPWGLAVDAGGTLLVADSQNNRIRMIEEGTMSTLAGSVNAAFGGDDGLATDARLWYPIGLTCDDGGNFYIADTGNHRIRKVSSSGVISTVAGNGNVGFAGDDGPATAATLNFPVDVAVDSDGNLVFSDSMNYRVRKIDLNGRITTIAGYSHGYAGDGGPATAAQLSFVAGLTTAADGSLYVADVDNNRIRKISPSGTITTVAGNGASKFSGDGGPATDAQLAAPYDVSLDSEGNLYIADQGNHRIRSVDFNGIIDTIAGSGIPGFAGDGGQATAAQLDIPSGVIVDREGNFFIADTANNRIRRVSTSGVITTVAGTGTYGDTGDAGTATELEFARPFGIALDPLANLLIVDTDNQRVLRVDP